MAIRKSSNTGIPFGGTSARPSNPANGQPYFNGDIGRLELYTSGTGWQNIVQETPGVASITGTYNESAGSGSFTVSGTNFVSGAIAYAVGTNGIEYQATTTTYNSLVQLSVVFNNLSAAYEPYDIKVTNPSNLFGLLPDAFYINDSPVWSTSSGSLGSYGSSTSIQLSATDDESNSITYSLVSGSLPNGLSLSSSGLISGTVSAPAGTYTFTVAASDGSNSLVTRSFNIIVPSPVVTGGTLSSDSTYYYRTFTGNGTLQISTSSLYADILMVAGGGGGGKHSGGGGGAGGLVYKDSIVVPVSSNSIVIGSGGTGRNVGSYSQSTDSGGAGSDGTNTTFLTYIAYGGGGGGSGGTGTVGRSGGSSGGSARNDGAAQAATQPSSATGGYGNIGAGTTSGAIDPNYPGHGGGGAGQQGQLGTQQQGGAGGNGLNTWSTWATATSTGVNGYYAGGGGANIQYGTGNGGAGGLGGGGNGGGYANGTASGIGYNGVTNTGGGGGGHAYDITPSQASSAGRNGNGGSGIVIVRYTKTQVGG